MKLLIHGAKTSDALPGLEPLPPNVTLCFADDVATFCQHLPSSEVVLCWELHGHELATHWSHATGLKWIHWCGAGVDAALFPDFAASEVLLTNSRGILDRAMAEYVLGYMLYVAKDFATTVADQQQPQWRPRLSRKLAGDTALIVGVGSIGREIARVLRGLGVTVAGVGRVARTDEDFGPIFTRATATEWLARTDWVIGVLPATPATENYFDQPFFATMPPHAQFINVGRGVAVVEADLIAALTRQQIAGALLDVCRHEPLPPTDPLWTTPKVFISPHLSGDYRGYDAAMVALFKHNLHCYLRKQPLRNVVDKQLGFVATNDQ